jgi:hypothetical protein
MEMKERKKERKKDPDEREVRFSRGWLRMSSLPYEYTTSNSLL